MRRLLPLVSLAAWLPGAPALAAAQEVHGLADLRLSHVDGAHSYLEGGYGKFPQGEGAGLVAQGALTYRADFGNGLGLYAIAVGDVRGDEAGLGVTEAYVQFRSLPSGGGLRLQGRAGLLYPRVSMENLLTAWSSPYTLDWSTQNAWLGEEVRHRGIELSVTRLGRFRGSSHDLSLGAALLRGNDPTGAMLAWHGWVSGSRQSLYREQLALPNSEIGFVPETSEPFIELDGRYGWHLHGEWEWRERGALLAGWYDNNADPKVLNSDVQWAWTTRFAHLGLKWRLPANLELIAQYLAGDTLMRSPRSRIDLVNNDFHSAYLVLSGESGPHRVSLRVEEFSVRDRDGIAVDDNHEYGKAVTLAWVFRLNRQWFLHGEYTRLHSDRPSRARQGEAVSLTERQVQLGLRFFF